MDPIVNFLSKAPDFLKHGILGVGFFLFIVSGYLLYLEQKKEPVRRMMLVSIFVYMFFTLLLFSGGIIAEVVTPPVPEPHIVSDSMATISVSNRQEFESQSIQPRGMANVELYYDSDMYEFIAQNVSDIVALDIAGAHLQNGVSAILPEINTILRNGGKIRVVITDPTDETTIRRQTERGSSIGPAQLSVEQVKYTASLINQTIIELNKLNGQNPSNKAEIKLVNTQLDERIHIVSLRDGTSKAFLKLYPYKHENRSLLFGGLYFSVLKGEQQQDYIFQYYANKFNNYFNNGIVPSEGVRVQLASLEQQSDAARQ